MYEIKYCIAPAESSQKILYIKPGGLGESEYVNKTAPSILALTPLSIII